MGKSAESIKKFFKILEVILNVRPHVDPNNIGVVILDLSNLKKEKRDTDDYREKVVKACQRLFNEWRQKF